MAVLNPLLILPQLLLHLLHRHVDRRQKILTVAGGHKVVLVLGRDANVDAAERRDAPCWP